MPLAHHFIERQDLANKSYRLNSGISPAPYPGDAETIAKRLVAARKSLAAFTLFMLFSITLPFPASHRHTQRQSSVGRTKTA